MQRDKELKYIKLLNQNGLGVPLIASFNNGIVSKLVSGISLEDQSLAGTMADPYFARSLF